MRRYGVIGVRKRVRIHGWTFWPWRGEARTPSGKMRRYVPIGVRTPPVARLRREYLQQTGVRLP
jgi:hypothetical protein